MQVPFRQVHFLQVHIFASVAPLQESATRVRYKSPRLLASATTRVRVSLSNRLQNGMLLNFFTQFLTNLLTVLPQPFVDAFERVDLFDTSVQF